MFSTYSHDLRSHTGLSCSQFSPFNLEKATRMTRVQLPRRSQTCCKDHGVSAWNGDAGTEVSEREKTAEMVP